MSILSASASRVGLAVSATLFALSPIAAGAADIPSRVAPAIRAIDLDGKVRTLPAKSSRATVLIFVLHDCPVCNRYAPEISRIAADYSTSRVSTFVVYEESDLTPSEARAHARAYNLACGLLYDPRHMLAHQVGATAAPEAVLLRSNGDAVYHGRIDDSFQHFGMSVRQPSTHDLRDALELVLAGKPIIVAQTPVVGCSIPPN